MQDVNVEARELEETLRVLGERQEELHRQVAGAPSPLACPGSGPGGGGGGWGGCLSIGRGAACVALSRLHGLLPDPPRDLVAARRAS